MPKISDPLCPLGFHPQVRWPTRCKRCFREYKDHISNSSVPASPMTRAASTEKLTAIVEKPTPQTLPSATATTAASSGKDDNRNSQGAQQESSGQTPEKPPRASHSADHQKDYNSVYSTLSGPALARLSKYRAAGGSPTQKPGSPVSRSDASEKTTKEDANESERLRGEQRMPSLAESSYSSPDLEFILQVKRSSGKGARSSDESTSIAGTDFTETTDTTLVDVNNQDLHDQINGLKRDVEKYRQRCERLERENEELTSKRYRPGAIGGSGSETARMQLRIRELETSNEDLLDEKRSAELRVAELERELETRPSVADTIKAMEELRAKSSAAEALIEELMEENEELKKDMRMMVEEMDELQDSFREDQVDEYRDLKKDLDQTAKNCRILQFKLRKAERRVEHLETEKRELESKLGQSGDSSGGNESDRVRKLELELSEVREQLARSQQEVQKMQSQPRVNKELPSAGPVLSKSRSLEGTLTSQRVAPEDLTQAQRDLQDCLEREADLREQLRFAEEESESFRKKVSRIEEENESLMMQLKKMTSKRGRRTNSEDTTAADDKSGADSEQLINDLRLQVELNEQETVVLRRKVEELERDNDKLSKEVARLQEQMKQSTGSESLDNLRTQLMEKDKEIQHLSEALTQAEKNKGKVVVQRSRSLEGESALDLKRQLQLVEQEAAILRSKTHDMETEHEKLVAENRKLTLRVSRKPPPTDTEQLLIDKLELEERLKSLEKKLSEATAAAKQAEPEKPRTGRTVDRNGRIGATSAESTVLKREKEILERENKAKEQQINEMNRKLQNLEKEKDNLHHRLDTLLMPVDRVPKKPTETMTKQQLKKMVEDLENEITHLTGKINALTAGQSGTTPEKIDELMRSLREEKEKREKAEHEKKNMEEKLKAGHHHSETLDTLRKKIEEMEKKNTEMVAKMKTGDFVDFDTLQQVKQEKHKLQKELADKDGKLSEADKKLKESEDKSKKLDRSLKEVRDRIEDVERQLEEEKNRHRQSESSYKELSVNWLKERDDLKKQITDYRSKLDEMDVTMSAKEKKIKELESNVKEELKKATDVSTRKLERDLNNAKEELQTFKAKAEDLEQKLVRAEMEKKSLNEKISRMEADWRKERDQLINRATDLDVEIKAEKKKRDRAEKEYEQDLRDKDDEIIGYKERVKRLDLELKAALEKYEDLKNQDSRSRELEIQLVREHQEYEDLTAKYDMLEEDYLVIKANLVSEKETIQREYLSLKKEYDTIENELRALRETFNLRQDTWIKEKLKMQERVKELEDKQSRSASDNFSIERNRLKSIIDEKNQQIEKIKKDNEAHMSHFDSIRKENEDLRRKLEDFDKVTKVQRSITFDTGEHDRIITELKNKLTQVEKTHRTELAQAKMRADNKLALLQEEANVAHMQLEKARRERDTFREMLDGAQRIIAELKAEHGHDKSGVKATAHEMEENLARIEELHARIMSLEDELNEARAEASRVKTELINEKSNRDVKFLELQTKINELEEEKIMSMGRSRITGVRTRIELAWQKEREEQQRMIQETSTLAKDLRQTLLEVEKERERERLESRRRLEQQKRANEEEQVDIRKKITELQSDLLELRDAHAKLRTSCEKLRRDKERVERERDEANRSATEARKFDSDSERRLQLLTVAIEKVKDLSPFMFGDSLASDIPITKKDRDTRNERAKEEFLSSLRQICNIGDEWKTMRQREDDPVKRVTLSKRAMSTTVDDKSSQNGSNTLSKSSAPSYPKRSQPTYRRSLSLEQSQNIKEASSSYDLNTSLNEPVYSYRSRTVERDQSLDRLSTDSTCSEPAVPATPETKKKKGLIGKLKQMTRSKSIEDSITAASLVSAGMQALVPSVSVDSDSELSLDVAVEKKKEKRSVKDKLTGVFRRSASRSNSMERNDSIEEPVSSSTERPLQRMSGRSTPTPAMTRASYSSSTLRSQRSVETDV